MLEDALPGNPEYKDARRALRGGECAAFVTLIIPADASLGDSGLTILRKGQPVFETQSQTHFFNCPVSLL